MEVGPLLGFSANIICNFNCLLLYNENNTDKTIFNLHFECVILPDHLNVSQQINDKYRNHIHGSNRDSFHATGNIWPLCFGPKTKISLFSQLHLKCLRHIWNSLRYFSYVCKCIQNIFSVKVLIEFVYLYCGDIWRLVPELNAAIIFALWLHHKSNNSSGAKN